jgi:hypothetical protein
MRNLSDFNAIKFYRNPPTFWRNVSCPYSGSTSKPSKKTLKMEAMLPLRYWCTSIELYDIEPKIAAAFRNANAM